MTTAFGEAVLLSSGGETAARNIGRLLEFFGVNYSVQTPDGFVAGASRSGPAHLFCSTHSFLEAAGRLEQSAEGIGHWCKSVASVFVYSDGDAASCSELSEFLDDESAPVSDTKQRGFVVADDPKLCGTMSGVSIKATEPERQLFEPQLVANRKRIIALGNRAGCILAHYNDVPMFISASPEIIDVDAQLPRGLFDIREHVLTALPVVLYVKWAFADVCWQPPETGACLIIDDPPLKRSYGFVDFTRLLALMKKHNFSTNIAFIPWNWNRSDAPTVKLFLDNPQHYSVSVHGCDHTRAEYGDGNAAELAARTQLALTRMADHQERTRLHHEPVMVFPQGVFSAAAMPVLKRSGLIGAVNNDTITFDSSPAPVTVRDVWSVALMKYGNFPLFTRRYPWEGIENFAFDALLGKPSISIIHHDACSDGCARLVEFVDQLNASRVQPVWRSLGEVLRRSYRQRRLGETVMEVEAFATELRLENPNDRAMEFRVRRHELDGALISRVMLGSSETEWRQSGEWVVFTAQLQRRERALVRFVYKELPTSAAAAGSRRFERARVMLRRHLCEVRDNYVTKAKLMARSALGKKETGWA